MNWKRVEDELPESFKDILFTDGKKIYRGFLELHDDGEDLTFFNNVSCRSKDAHWPENITHWMEIPDPPK